MQSTPADREYILFHRKQNQIGVPYAERALLHILRSHRKAAAVAVKSELNIQMQQPSTPCSPHKPSTGTGKDICEGSTDDTAISFTLTHVTWRFKKYLREEPGIISLLQAPAVGTLRKLDQLPWLPPSASSALLHLPSPSVISFFYLVSSHMLWGWFTYLLTN